jgi:hypothetical protein
LNNGKIWAVGTDGAVVKSTNSGTSWQTVDISGATNYHFNAVFFADANNGFIVGEKKADSDKFKGVIYRTTNSGATWDASVTYTPAMYIPFKDITFDIREGGNADIGYIAAGEGYIYKTTNRGANWSREQVDNTKSHCFHGVWIDLTDGTVRAAGDAGNSTGIVVTNTPGGWQVEYPFSELGLNFFDISSEYDAVGIAASKGYLVFKEYSNPNWTANHYLSDQQIFYAINICGVYISPYFYMLGGSDQTIRKGLDDVGGIFHNAYSQSIKGVSPASSAGHPILPVAVTYFVGTSGTIFKYTHDTYDMSPTATVYGEATRVKFEIYASEAAHIYVYRTTCPDGPYISVGDFNCPSTGQDPYIWYDTTVDWNIDYYYKISPGLVNNNPAHPTGLDAPPSPPAQPTNFYAGDIPFDDGARVYLAWYWVSPSYTLYKDNRFIQLTTGYEFYDDSATTGVNHTYKIRKREYYTPENDYIYSAPATVSCTPVNNLVPSAPDSLRGTKFSATEIKIRWDEPNNIDIAGYNIYRKLFPGGSYTKINSVSNPRAFWRDTLTGSWSVVYYKVTTVDWSGNESGYSNEIHFVNKVAGGQGLEFPLDETVLTKITPNPTNKNVFIHFTLAKDDFVQIETYDVSGRKVERLISGTLSKGSYNVRLKIEDNPFLSNGVYFVKMKSSDYQAVEKLVIRR